VDLISPGKFKIPDVSVFDAIARRRSHRNYTGQPLSQTELSFLLWATQGVRDVLADGKYTLRSVPSAGARHPFETYILAQQVTGLDPALYRYLPVEHKLLLDFCSLKIE
ncbi:MAG: nitroreductase family protein, partial [Chloroflexota bacterium]